MTETLNPPTTHSEAVDRPTIRGVRPLADILPLRPTGRALNVFGLAPAHELVPTVDVDSNGNITIWTTTRRGSGRETVTSTFDTAEFFAGCAADAELRVKMLEALTDRERKSRLPDWMQTR